MTEKQRFLIYVHLGQVLACVMRENGLPMTVALQNLSDSQLIEKVEDIETGYYLESGAYLYEEYKKLSTVSSGKSRGA